VTPAITSASTLAPLPPTTREIWSGFAASADGLTALWAQTDLRTNHLMTIDRWR
jgi:hypothetical protein